MKRFLKFFLLTTALVLVIFSLASCGNSAANPESASGNWESIAWSYDKGTHTLTFSGEGEIPNAASAADVPWASVRNGVKSISFKPDAQKSFTAIGDYAFYGMAALEELDIPAGVESLGKCSVAFCKNLADVKLSETVATIGVSAFEGCSKLAQIELPASVTTIDDRAFAFCHELSALTVNGAPLKVGAWCFKDCAKLETLRTDATDIPFDASAFEGAAMSSDDIKSLSTSLVTIECKDENGEVIKTVAGVAVLDIGQKEKFSAPAIESYDVVGETEKEIVGDGNELTVVFEYKTADSDENDASAAPDANDSTANNGAEKEPNKIMSIIAIVIFVVVIAAIAIGAVVLIRSDKKTGKDSRTVRKNGKGKK